MRNRISRPSKKGAAACGMWVLPDGKGLLEPNVEVAALPPREYPDPDPQHIAAARQFRAIADRILDIDTRLRGAAVPPDDKIWLRQRGELETLQRLGNCDVVLVADAKELASAVADLPAEVGIDPAIEQQIDQHLGRLVEALTRRDEI